MFVSYNWIAYTKILTIGYMFPPLPYNPYQPFGIYTFFRKKYWKENKKREKQNLFLIKQNKKSEKFDKGAHTFHESYRTFTWLTMISTVLSLRGYGRRGRNLPQQIHPRYLSQQIFKIK